MKSISRGEFLGLMGASAAMLAGGCACPFKCGAKPRYALQLYSIHKIFWSAPEKALAALRAGGFDGVEFYDYGGKTAGELRRMCADAELKAMRSLVEIFHRNGGSVIQFTVFSAEELRDAQAHPEKYENLQVRVCGWNVRWNDLCKSEQDAYIRRAENVMKGW